MPTIGHRCNSYTILGQKHFPLDEFEGLYREHMFLHHPLVHDNTKQSQSDVIDITAIVNKQHFDEDDSRVLINALEEYEKYSVIRFANLHEITIHENSPLWRRFNSIIA